MQSTCPDATTWRAFIDGLMTDVDRASAESHLVRCGVCRGRLVGRFDEAQETGPYERAPEAIKKRAIEMGFNARPTNRFMDSLRPYMPLALAATVVLAVGISIMLYRTTNQPPITDLRQSGNTTQELILETPPNGMEINAGRLEFRWKDAGPGLRYQFTLTDEKGDIVVQENSTSNSLVLDSSRLSPGRKYYWSVSARSPDGTIRESDVASFTLK